MRICLFGLSANPPAVHHRKIVEELAKLPWIDRVIVVPCGGRPDKLTTNDIEFVHRAAMTRMTFAGIDKAEVDLFDLENDDYTPTTDLEKRFHHLGEIWHYVGADLICGGSAGKSKIQTSWKDGQRLFRESNFIVGARPGYKTGPNDYPPHHRVLGVDFGGASRKIRNMVFSHRRIDNLVVPRVSSHIERYGLYRGSSVELDFPWQIENPRISVVADETNRKAMHLAERLQPLEAGDPDLIVVIGGDGFMLRTIKLNKERQIPFFGINVGHRGFLLNDVADNVDPGIFSQKLYYYHQPLIHAEITMEDRCKESVLAFNDVWVQVGLGKTAWIRLKVDNEPFIDRLISDGVLVATTAGSGAYARSMGARPLPIKGLIMVGNNVMRPFDWKMAQLPLSATVEIENIDRTSNPRLRPLFGFADGEELGQVAGMKIRVSRTASAELVFLPKYRLGRKLVSIQRPEINNEEDCHDAATIE